MGVSPQMIGAMQAQIAIDYLLSARLTKTEKVKLKLISTQSFGVYELDLQKSSTCHLCSPKMQNDESQTIGDTGNYVESRFDKSRTEPFPIPISIEEVQERLSKGWLPSIIDVRRPDEREQGYIKKSIHREASLLLAQLENFDSRILKDKDLELYQDLLLKDILVYCARGPRAEKVARALHNTRQKLSLSESLSIEFNNKNDIYELVGGYSMWSR